MAQIAAVAVGVGQMYKAYQTKKFKEKEAEAFNKAADQRLAAATHEGAQENRNREYMNSRQIALAAASGAGVDDPTVVNLNADLNTEGRYRQMARLWVGANDAEGLQFRAEAAQREADQALTIGAINAVTSAFTAYKAFS